MEYISPLILLILIAHNYDEIMYATVPPPRAPSFNKSKSIPDNHSYDIAKSFLDAHSLDLDYTDTQNSNPLPSLNNPGTLKIRIWSFVDVKVENIFDDPNRYDDLLSEQASIPLLLWFIFIRFSWSWTVFGLILFVFGVVCQFFLYWFGLFVFLQLLF